MVTLIHKGEVKMTRPNIFAIILKERLSTKCSKIFLRVLLYCTSKTGRAVESMYIKVIHGDHILKFQYWTYGEREKLVPGSGMFVGPKGYEANHHFTPVESAEKFDFKSSERAHHDKF